jgi:uncharacterized membrane protein (DUF106 family)
MVFDNYVTLVALAAVFYALVVRIIQNKLTDRTLMKKIQEESKHLSKELKEANEAKDQARIDAAMKKQMEFFPKMNKVMIGQFKPMIVILIVLYGFNWVISTFDPSLTDDTIIALNDLGAECDKLADDGIYSGCYEIANENTGKWVVTAKAYKGESEAGMNSTYFLYNMDENKDNHLEPATGESFSVSTDQDSYYSGDTVAIFADAPIGTTQVSASLNNGTSFYVDLPFTIPILNVQRIQQPYWWFIFIAIIAGIIMSLVYGRLQKAGVLK